MAKAKNWSTGETPVASADLNENLLQIESLDTTGGSTTNTTETTLVTYDTTAGNIKKRIIIIAGIYLNNTGTNATATVKLKVGGSPVITKTLSGASVNDSAVLMWHDDISNFANAVTIAITGQITASTGTVGVQNMLILAA